MVVAGRACTWPSWRGLAAAETRRRAALLGIPAVGALHAHDGDERPRGPGRASVYCPAGRGQLLRRESDSLTTLLFALAVLLLRNPLAVHSIGLQLSFAAMAGILLVSSPWRTFFRLPGAPLDRAAVLRRIGQGVSRLAAVSVGANVFRRAAAAWHFAIFPSTAC
jgi:hypothetical protein